MVLFLDDLTVATGRPKSLPAGTSGAADVVEANLSFSVTATSERLPRQPSSRPLAEPQATLGLGGPDEELGEESSPLGSGEARGVCLAEAAHERGGDPAITSAPPVLPSGRRFSVPQAAKGVLHTILFMTGAREAVLVLLGESL